MNRFARELAVSLPYLHKHFPRECQRFLAEGARVWSQRVTPVS
jgi:hypothetical protein